MSPLQKSYDKEADRIENRKSVWVQAPNGKWYHSYDRKLVKQTIEGLRQMARINQ